MSMSPKQFNLLKMNALRARVADKLVEKARIAEAKATIEPRLSFLDAKVTESNETYVYWLNYKTPSDCISDRSISNSYDQLMSWVSERKDLLASVGIH